MVRIEREFRSYSSGIGGGPSLPPLEQYNPHGPASQQYLTPARVMTPWNTLTVQRRGVTSTITSGLGYFEEVNTSGLSTLPSASASPSISATVLGFSTGGSPINPVPDTAVDLTIQELANTDGTTENVEDLQSRMAN